MEDEHCQRSSNPPPPDYFIDEKIGMESQAPPEDSQDQSLSPVKATEDPKTEDLINEKNDGMMESQAPPEDSQGQILGPVKANEDPKAEQIATTKGTVEPSTSGLKRAPSQIFGDNSSMPKTKKQKLAVTDSQP